MILVEMPLAFAALAFILGFYYFLLNLKNKALGGTEMNLPCFSLMIFGVLFGSVWILIIKYTFLEGIFLRCPDIKFLCN